MNHPLGVQKNRQLSLIPLDAGRDEGDNCPLSK